MTASRLLSRFRKFYGARFTLNYERYISCSPAIQEETEAFSPMTGKELPKTLCQQRKNFSSSKYFVPVLMEDQDLHGFPCQSFRFSGMSGASNDLDTEDNFITFFRSTIDKYEGPDFLWLNRSLRNKDLIKKDGVFIFLANAFGKNSIENSHCKHRAMFEIVRSLQQRYPALQILGFQSVSSVCSPVSQCQIVRTIMEEFTAFPILLVERNFTEIPSGPSYLLYTGLNSPCIIRRGDIKQSTIEEDLERFGISHEDKSMEEPVSSSTEVMEEPQACSPFRNLLLYYPSCISTDSHGNHLFISDTNHHRIIIADTDGQILDCIGSSPGFEDGDFDSSKLLRPAGSVYHAGENCLYFVDAENCAVRKADLRERVVETVYPVQDKKVSGLWSWFLEKFGIRREINGDDQVPFRNMIASPWHLMMSGDDDLLIFNRSFETLWVISRASGEIKDIRNDSESFSNALASHESVITEASSLLKKVIPQLNDPASDLMSSVVSLQKDIIYCDAVGQRIFKCSKSSGNVAEILLTNLYTLGMPYWIPGPIENVAFRRINESGEQMTEHLQSFNILPGRCDIRVKIQVPEGTSLAEPLTESCVWRQGRGAAAEISAPALAAASADKVGIAQQWFDELDNLAFISVPSQGNEDGPKVNPVDPKTVHVNCAVKTSPGTSEVIVSAVLYLRIADDGSSLDRKRVRRVLGLEEKSKFEACVDLMLESHEKDKDIVFSKPVRLRIRLDCGDHPPSTSSKDMLSTDSSLEVSWALA